MSRKIHLFVTINIFFGKNIMPKTNMSILPRNINDNQVESYHKLLSLRFQSGKLGRRCFLKH